MQHLLFVEVDSVVMHTTSITTTSRMLSVLACGSWINWSLTMCRAHSETNGSYGDHL